MPNLVGIGNSQTPTNAMLGGLAYQDSVGEINIEKIKASAGHATTPVDIFVYDTRKDSDGGAWRHRTQNKSWYNEGVGQYRGSRKEFPAVAVLVLESNRLVIYDGDDPNLSMWMVFLCDSSYMLRVPSPSSVAMLNAKMVVGEHNNYAGSTVDFIMDIKDAERDLRQTVRYGNIADRNNNSFQGSNGGRLAVGQHTNDVAMIVLPNAPIHPDTGLPIPTIAVATDAGFSIIKDTIPVTVVDTPTSGAETHQIAWMSPSRLVVSAPAYYGIFEDPFVEVSDIGYISGGADSNYYGTSGNWRNTPHPMNTLTTSSKIVAPDHRTVVSGSTYGLDIRQLGGSSITDNNDGLVSHITFSYNTGYLQGDNKGAFLAGSIFDADSTSVIGGELVTNGTFASNNVTGWTERESGGSFTASGGQATLAYSSGVASWRQDITIVSGKTYTLSFDVVSTTTSSIQFYYNHGTGDLGVSMTGSAGKFSVTFVAASNSVRIFPRIFASGNMVLDNISLCLAVDDRRYNGNGFQVFGTITKEPVVSGADLISYGGWSTSNYLLQPFNSDLNLSPGDYTIMAWIYPTGTGTGGIISRGSAGEYGPWAVSYSAQDATFVSSHDWDQSSSDGGSWGTVISSSGDQCKLNKWSQIVVRKSGLTAELYIDGILKGTDTSSYDPKVPTTNLIPTMIGVERRGGTGAINRPFPGRLALIRVSNTAASEEQIVKMYREEKQLFLEGAKGTLIGSSNTVNAVAYDDSNDVLHVGTSGGRSDFRGLSRINNTTTAVTTEISASNGLIAEQ